MPIAQTKKGFFKQLSLSSLEFGFSLYQQSSTYHPFVDVARKAILSAAVVVFFDDKDRFHLFLKEAMLVIEYWGRRLDMSRKNSLRFSSYVLRSELFRAPY